MSAEWFRAAVMAHPSFSLQKTVAVTCYFAQLITTRKEKHRWGTMAKKHLDKST